MLFNLQKFVLFLVVSIAFIPLQSHRMQDVTSISLYLLGGEEIMEEQEVVDSFDRQDCAIAHMKSLCLCLQTPHKTRPDKIL